MPDRWNANDWREHRRLMPPTPGSSHTPAVYARRSPRKKQRQTGRTIRLLILIALWLGILIWPAPQLGSYISQHLLTHNPISSLIKKGISQLPGGVETFVPSDGPHTVWQVGLAADSGSSHATGMRATIQTRVPQKVADNTTNYYWVGSYLSDGSFIQIGYYVGSDDPSEAGWFYCAFHANGSQGPCQYGAKGSAGDDGEQHRYTLETIGDTSSGQPQWQASMDDTPLGQFAWSARDSGQYTPDIYAESSGYSPHDSSSVLGPVDFMDGVQWRGASGSDYQRAAHVSVMYSATNVCPPYGVASDGHDGALLGSGLACPARFSQLW